AGAAAGQAAPREQVTDVRNAGHHTCHLAGRRDVRHSVDLDPYVAAVRPGRPGQHTVHGLAAFQSYRDGVYRHWSLGRLQDQPVRVLRVRTDEAFAMHPQEGLERWGRGADREPVEDLVRRSFVFLLEREPATSILRTFDLSVISRYFPEYDRRFSP